MGKILVLQNRTLPTVIVASAPYCGRASAGRAATRGAATAGNPLRPPINVNSTGCSLPTSTSITAPSQDLPTQRR